MSPSFRPSFRGPTAALLLTLSVGMIWGPGSGLRRRAEKILMGTEADQGSSDDPEWTDNAEGDTEGESSSCWYKNVTDGDQCGHTEKLQEVTSISCGVKYCAPDSNSADVNSSGAPQPCGYNTCNITTREDNTCEVIDKCPVKLRIFFQGQASVGSVSQTNFDAQLKSLQVMEGANEVREYISANTELMHVAASAMIMQGVIHGRAVGSHVGQLVIDEIVRLASGEDIVSQLQNGGDDPSAALEATVRETIANLRLSFLPYTPESLAHHQLARASRHADWFCSRWLQVRVRGEPDFYIANWNMVELAKTFNGDTGCESTFFAQCSAGGILEERTCPDTAPIQQQRCLRGPGCRLRNNPVINSELVSVRLPHLIDMKLFGNQRGKIRLNVARARPGRGLQMLEETEEMIREREQFEESRTEVLVTAERFQTIYQDHMCVGRRVRRCRRTSSTLFRWFKKRLNLNVSHNETMAVRVGFQDGNLKVAFAPPWSAIKRLSEQMIMGALNNVSLPVFNTTVSSANAVLDPDGEDLNLNDGTYVDVWGAIEGDALSD